MKIQRRTPHGRLAPAMPRRRLPGATSIKTAKRTACRHTLKATARRRSL
jgi:hypothetical protein